MSTAIAIFVKTPALSPVKTRLAATIGVQKAQEFYHLSLKSVEKTVRNLNVSAYWAVAEEGGLPDPLWQNFPCLHTGEGELGERQHHIYESLLAKHEHVLLVGADAPQLSKEYLEKAITTLDTNDFVIGPACDGGYYLFGGRISLPQEIWRAVPWSTSTTRECLEKALPSKPVHLSPLTDVDTKEDLVQMTTEMPIPTSVEQKRLLKWVEHSI